MKRNDGGEKPEKSHGTEWQRCCGLKVRSRIYRSGNPRQTLGSAMTPQLLASSCTGIWITPCARCVPSTVTGHPEPIGERAAVSLTCKPEEEDKAQNRGKWKQSGDTTPYKAVRAEIDRLS